MSAYQREELNKYLYKMLAEGKIVHSKSPAGAPILFVPKEDGRLRLCVDQTLRVENSLGRQRYKDLKYSVSDRMINVYIL